MASLGDAVLKHRVRILRHTKVTAIMQKGLLAIKREKHMRETLDQSRTTGDKKQRPNSALAIGASTV